MKTGSLFCFVLFFISSCFIFWQLLLNIFIIPTNRSLFAFMQLNCPADEHLFRVILNMCMAHGKQSSSFLSFL